MLLQKWHRVVSDSNIKNTASIKAYPSQVSSVLELGLLSDVIFCLYYMFIFFVVTTPHFLTIKGVEVNAGQTASFHCTVNGRKRDSFRLWLQVRSICVPLPTL